MLPAVRCRAATAPARRAATLVAAAAVALATAVLTSPPAQAADIRTYLPGVTGVGDVAAGGGRILIAAVDRVVVTDPRGAITGTVGNLRGAVGLALTPDGSRAYVALRDANQVAELDPARRRIVRRIDLPAAPCPTRLALAGGRLWVAYGCPGSDAGVLSIDPTARRPVPVVVRADLYVAPVIAAAGSVLTFGVPGSSPGYAEVFAIGTGGAVTRRGSVPGEFDIMSNLQDLALSPDGRLLVTSFGAPYQHFGWDTTTLAEVHRYGGTDFGGYPTAVAISPDGSQVAAGWSSGPDLSVHVAATGETRYTTAADGDLLSGTLDFSGGDVVGVLNDWQAGTFFLWVARGAALPASTLTLTAPASATALQPLTVSGRLTLAGGTAPGRQRITVTRRLPDGTTTALPAVTTGTGGRFSIRDTPPVGGEVTYTAEWAGSSAHRGSTASVTVPVAKVPVTLTLTGPASAAVGDEVRLTGTVRLGGAVPSAPVGLAAVKKVVNNAGSYEQFVADVTSTAGGDFAFTDTLTAGGQVTYEIRRGDTEVYEAGQASHLVAVSSRTALVTGTMQWPSYVGEAYPVSGSVLYETGDCAGPTTVHLTRQVGDGPVETRPDLTTDASCNFAFTDTLTAPGEVRYGLRWDGDAGHAAATGEITGTVTKIPAVLDVQPEDYYVQPGQRVAIDGLLMSFRTGPLPGQAVTVTRTDWTGATVTLPGVSTGADGRFAITDTLPAVDPADYPWFQYEFRWAGNGTYTDAVGVTTIYVRESD